VALQPVTVLAVSRMQAGLCTAGFSTESDPTTHLRWVRPVRNYDTLLVEDLIHSEGDLARCCDVLELDLLRPTPTPPHIEDYETNFVKRRPRLLRRLEGNERAEFLANHLDTAPGEVLVETKRTLCLVRPEDFWASFSLDGYSGKCKARFGFRLADGVSHPQAESNRGVSATDVRWCALGRDWLGANGGTRQLQRQELLERLGATDLYLTIGLSRQFQDQYWPLVVGVHTVPDYEVRVDLGNL